MIASIFQLRLTILRFSVFLHTIVAFPSIDLPSLGYRYHVKIQQKIQVQMIYI